MVIKIASWLCCELFFVSVMLSGCESSTTPRSENGSVQSFFFEINYENGAWGYSNAGMYIDRDGRMYSYTYKGSQDVFPIHENGMYTADEMRRKYEHGTAYTCSVVRDTIDAMMALIPAAAKGALDKPEQTAADMGILSYWCYQYNATTQMYTQVLLKRSGDLTQHNLSQEAATLLVWLESFHFTPN